MKRAIFVTMSALLTLVAMACVTERSSSPVEGTLKIPNSFGYGSSDDGIVVQFIEVTKTLAVRQT
jgi:hypothetical protein